MDRLDLLLSQLHAASMLVEDIDDPQSELHDELRLAMQEAIVKAYRLKLGRRLKQSVPVARVAEG
jgi:hypothetical protein